MKKIIAATAAVLTLAAVPAFAGEGNGAPFALRTSPIASMTVAARPDTVAEGRTGLAADAGEVPVRTTASVHANTLDGGFAAR